MVADDNIQHGRNDIGGIDNGSGKAKVSYSGQATGDISADDAPTNDAQPGNNTAGDAETGNVTTRETLRIKNMVCDRCIMTVEELLHHHGFHVVQISLGEAVISPKPDADRLAMIEKNLEEKGFHLARDHREQMVSAIKSELIAYLGLIELQQEPPLLSDYLSAKMHRSYPTLSRTFTALEGHSIEQHLIRLRTERVKELLSFDEHTLSEIAWQLGYSSVQHLSAQFKKVTGQSVSEYKKARGSSRQKLDAIR